jgi:tetratricopeptide (TPR) repeat protein
MVLFGILVISLILIAGCVSPGPDTSRMTAPQPPAPGDPSSRSGGSALAVAFRADEIPTTFPGAKERFLTGLEYSTQYARYNDSLEYFDAALAIDRNFSEAWTARGVALHNLKRYDEAVQDYNRALAIDPRDAGTWSLKAIALRAMGKPAEAAECDRMAAGLDPRYRSVPGAEVTQAPAQACDRRLPPVPAGGDVYLGESCLDVRAGVSSGQVISWYEDGRAAGKISPGVTRVVTDAGNFFVDPHEFLGYEGNWYIGNTDTIAFVVRVPVLDSQKNSTG